ncbi:MAG TPA: glycosyltransferase, partial [Mycobacterium sp.]|nr:glycosyltransferase [Mycobacterium sp.]
RPLPQHERVQVVYLPQAIGQRAATNLAARISTAPYICKLDAHCAVAHGMDVALLEAADTLGRTVVQVPLQKHLHVYDQVCDPCGWRADQAPAVSCCPRCGGPIRKDLIWKMRKGSTRWRFRADLHFDYRGFAQEGGPYRETMSCLGACWFIDRGWFWELGGLDEGHGSYGQMGTEIACKVWLSGGRLVCNTTTEYAHFFRVGGIGFPYELRQSDVERAREYSRSVWLNNAWPGQVRPLRWLVDKFWPIEGWSEEQRDALPS